MKAFFRYLWIFSLVQIFSFTSISSFNVPKLSSIYSVPNYWSGGNICAATVFLWSLTCCTSNSHRLPEMLATKHREGKGIRHMKTMKSKNSKNGSKIKTDRQGSDVTEDKPNEIVIIEDLRSHLISKLGVLDPMMCLPKALCGLSSASTASPNSSSELVKDYLHHMKAVILTTTPAPPLPVTEKSNGTNDLKLSQNEEANFDDEDSESEDTEEDDEEDEENEEDTSEEEEDEENDENKFYDNYNRYRTESIEDGDDEDEDLPTESDEQLLRDYLADKTEVTQYLDEEDFQDIPSWWDNVPTKDMTIPLTPISSWASALTSYIPSGMTSWLTSSLPSFSWDLGAETRQEGIFEKDPFFTTFRSGGRSLGESSTSTNSESHKDKQLLTSDFKAKLKKRKKILNQYRKLKKKIKRRQERKLKHKEKPPPSSLKKLLKKIKRMNKRGNLTQVVLSKRIIQQELLDGMDSELSQIENPIARLKTAVEIGKKLDDPRKCNILFSACPWKYDEVLEIIEDSHKFVKGASSEIKRDKVKKKTSTKEKGGKGSALEKLKQSLKANSKNSSTIDLPNETVVKHPLPGGGHLEVKFSHSESNKVEKNPPKTKKISSSLLKPFQETKYLGVKTEKKKRKQKKPIEYKYPKYNYRVSFPNTDHKSIIISQYEEITTKRPRPSTTTTTEPPEEESTTKMPKREKTNSGMKEINVEDSGENIIIRIPKEKHPADTYTRNPLVFNPFRIYSPQYPSYSNQPQPYPAPAPAPTLIPAPQYYNQYYQPQFQLQPQPQLQPTPWYYYNNNRNNYQIKRNWDPNRNPYFKTRKIN